MKLALRAWLVLLTVSACTAPEEAYLTLQVSYAEGAQGKFGRIVLLRNSGTQIDDGFFEVKPDALQRRIAVHAERDELGAELELQLSLCDDREGHRCPEISILGLQNVFEAGQTTELCLEFTSLARGRWPDPIDLATGSMPEGLVECRY